jgi:hypothetical protein
MHFAAGCHPKGGALDLQSVSLSSRLHRELFPQDNLTDAAVGGLFCSAWAPGSTNGELGECLFRTCLSTIQSIGGRDLRYSILAAGVANQQFAFTRLRA